MAGRGWGKTRTGAEYIRREVEAGRAKRIALVGMTPADVRDVMIEGESGLLNISPPWMMPVYTPSRRRLEWPNGAVAITYSGYEPDQLNGPQHDLAWCFVAGTMITTPDGQRPIESLKVGDAVLTRNGARLITATGNRKDCVGRIKFSDGTELVATAQHPVLQLHGWTRIDHLEKGAIVWTGKRRLTGTWLPTLMGARSTSIGGFGNNQTGQSLQDTKSTTKTKTRKTTTSTTWNYWQRLCIEQSMLRPRNLIQSNAKIVGLNSHTESEAVSLFANLANTAGQKRSERSIGSAKSAERASNQESPAEVLEVSAVSVASTWAVVGQDTVYNLTVDGEHEYIANGIIVHNCDELRTWKYARETWDMLMLGLRLGKRPRCIVTTTPKPIDVIRELLKSPTTVVTRGSTYDNRAFLADTFFAQVVNKYQNTRLGRQEIDAELLDDVPGALWTRKNITYQKAPDLQRIVVAVDPATSSGESSDETGIIVSSKGVDGRFYILADRSGRLTPDGWARRAWQVFDDFKADRIIYEDNQGGEMVAATLKTVRPSGPIKSVHASRSKQARAEPISALYEQGKVSHIEPFKELEDQLCTWTPEDGESPDRLDALVWGMTELSARTGHSIYVG